MTTKQLIHRGRGELVAQVCLLEMIEEQESSTSTKRRCCSRLGTQLIQEDV